MVRGTDRDGTAREHASGEPERSAAGARAWSVSVGVAAFVGEWLPIAAAVALLAHLTLLGLRPTLRERAFLEERRDRIEAETAELDARLDELERLERALDDPIYRERLYWQWRLAGDGAGTVGATSGSAAGAGGDVDVDTGRRGTRDDLPPLAPRPERGADER